MRISSVFLLILLVGSQIQLWAANSSSAPGGQKALGNSALKSLSGLLRTIILNELPDPLYEKKQNWGRQSMSPSRLTWKKRGIFRLPRLVKRLKNDGVWRKTTVTARGLPDSIEFQLSELRLLEDNSLRFSIECSLPVLVRNEKQRWENGVQIYGGSTEARMSLYLRATCDARRMIGRSEEGKPEIVIKMDVIEANVDYGDLEWQKVAGVAGDGGELLGKGLQSIVEDIFPKLKRKLIAKARRAVFKAADDKEFRIKISSLFGQ